MHIYMHVHIHIRSPTILYVHMYIWTDGAWEKSKPCLTSCVGPQTDTRDPGKPDVGTGIARPSASHGPLLSWVPSASSVMPGPKQTQRYMFYSRNRKLEHDRSPTSDQSKKGNQCKSSYIHVPAFQSLRTVRLPCALLQEWCQACIWQD